MIEIRFELLQEDLLQVKNYSRRGKSLSIKTLSAKTEISTTQLYRILSEKRPTGLISTNNLTKLSRNLKTNPSKYHAISTP